MARGNGSNSVAAPASIGIKCLSLHCGFLCCGKSSNSQLCLSPLFDAQMRMVPKRAAIRGVTQSIALASERSLFSRVAWSKERVFAMPVDVKV